MVEIRLVEETVQTLYNDGHIRGSTHLANGQEAVSVGIAVAARPTDTVTCTYRGHGTALALGVTPEGVLGEICGRSIGCIGGIGGSMHLGDMSVGLLPTFAIVGAGVPVAAGAALTAWVRGTDDAAIAIFGDGSTNIGAFHEGLNLAGILKLPVVFVCENNLYGEYTPDQPHDTGRAPRRSGRRLRNAWSGGRRTGRRRGHRRRRVRRSIGPAPARVRPCWR